MGKVRTQKLKLISVPLFDICQQPPTAILNSPVEPQPVRETSSDWRSTWPTVKNNIDLHWNEVLIKYYSLRCPFFHFFSMKLL